MFAYALRRPCGLLMGGCELRMLTARSVNVSYWVFPQFRQQGYAARALALLCESAARVPGLERVEAHIAPDNLASRRLAERCGFVEAGTVREEAWTGAISTMARYVRRIG
jgi:RimJ/RimL family protein N-acetyltransferase